MMEGCLRPDLLMDINYIVQSSDLVVGTRDGQGEG